MAYITLNANKLGDNYNYLNNLFKKNSIRWSIVSKLLCGDPDYLKVLLSFNPDQLCDSRVSNLKMIKKLSPGSETAYIKPPPKRSIKSIVQFADISYNTEFQTIKLLSEEAQRQDKIHKIVIMIEMGELREGVMREDFMEFFEKVFQLPNIEVIGIGTNLTCMYGVLPNSDKLIQLSLYEQLIEAKFKRSIPYVSGGSSVTIPLIHQGILPEGINHFRVGETLFLGTNVYDGSKYEEMHNDVFKLYAEIIELTEKPMVPEGDLGANLEGESFEFDDEDLGKTSFRAILDMGLLDIDDSHIKLADKTISIVGASSDMIVADLGENKNRYKVGDLLEFNLDYMATLRALSSNYIDKRVV
ncbi:MAG: alanine racemase [Bacteroidota bacterium]